MSWNKDEGGSDKPKASLSLSEKYKKWDAIAKEADNDPECDNRDELNKFFQTIYKDSDEDARRAMMKSYSESGGTVLSTNWKDVGQRKVDVKPPENMEYKNLMNSLTDTTCHQIENLIDSSIHVLKDCERNDESKIREALEKSDELIQAWTLNHPRLPAAFREKIVANLQSYIVDLESAFFNFGDYAAVIVSVLQQTLVPADIQRLLNSAILKPKLDNPSYIRILEHIIRIMESKNNDLKMSITPLFFGPTPCIDFKRLDNTKIHMCLAQVYMTLLPPNNILHLQQFYPLLVDKLKNEIEVLKEAAEKQSTRMIKQSVNVINLLLAAIYPLSTVRNSFLIMALNPSLIDLCLNQLPTNEMWFISKFPLLQRSILSIAFTFGKTYDFFTATSSLNRLSKFLGESPSSHFCYEQMNTLASLLTYPEKLTNGTLEFAVEWLFSIVRSFGTDISTVYEKQELFALRKAVLFLYFNDSISTPTKIDNIADNLKVFDVMPEFDDEETSQFWSKFRQSSKLKKLTDSHKIWKQMPALFLCKSFLLTSFKLSKEKHRSLDAFSRASHVRNFLFSNNKHAFDQRIPRLNEQNFLKPEWQYILAEFANDVCDGISFLPTQREICSLVIDELNRIKNENVSSQNTYYNQGLNRLNHDRKENMHLRVSCLLDLLLQLDKSTLAHLYGHDLQRLSPKLRLTSEMALDFNAILGLFNFAYKSGNYEMIVMFAFQYLLQHDHTNRMFNSELLSITCWLIRCYVELKDAQSINGLKMWLTQNFNVRFVWVDYAEMLAGGRFETALINLDLLTSEQHSNNHSVVTETIFILRERALKTLLEPSLCHQCAPAFYSQFMRPIGSPPIFNTDLLNSDAVLELSSWNQFDRLRTPAIPPNYEATSSYNLFSALDQIESNMASMHKIFSNFGAQSIPDVLNCLDESEKRIVNLSRHLPDFGLSSSLRERVFPLQVLINLFRDVIFSSNAVDNSVLNQLLLNSTKFSVFERTQIGQKIATWVERIFGCDNTRFTELNSAMIKLNRKTGNLMLANNYLNKSPRGVLNQTILKNNFGELTNLNEALTLEILRNDPSNAVGLMQKFFAVADQTASHLDVHLTARDSSHIPEPIIQSCLRLAKTLQTAPINCELILSKISKSNSIFWKKVNENLNNYRSASQGAPINQLLTGAFITTASCLSNEIPKTYKRLAEWAISDISTDISKGVDAIRLLPNEEVSIQALCGAGILGNKHDSFLEILGHSDDIDEFELTIQNSSEFGNDVLSGIQCKSFKQLWDTLKARQQFYYNIAVNALLNFLKFEHGVTISDQISSALHVLDLLTSHPNYFSQIDSTFGWIEHTNINVWVRIVQHLFSRLNHQNQFIRDTLKSLIEKIGLIFPHAICYFAFVRSYKGNDFERNQHLKDTFSSQICFEIIETLRTTHPDLIRDVELFVSEFQRLTLTSEKWLFVLNHLEIDLLNSLKQIEKERIQLIDVAQTEDKADMFVREATTIVYNNAFSIIDDLYQSTCGEDAKTIEQQRFIKNFKEMINSSIRDAKSQLKRQNPTFNVFKKLTNRLGKAISMQSQYRIKLSNLSFKLASASNLSLPILGQESTNIAETVKIQSIDQFIQILPTKTRPKKIAFIGSDGLKYQFLYKEEDLRVDQHISNLFSICNFMFEKTNRHDPLLPYFIPCYSVTPLGLRSGLIQWVDNCSSIYTIYRHWRTAKLNQLRIKRTAPTERSINLDDALKSPERKQLDADVFDIEMLSAGADPILDHDLSQHSAACLELSPKPETPKNPPRILRHDNPDQALQRLMMSPMNLFANVLKAKLNENNISHNVIKNRKNWPKNVLEEVFDELSTMVPSSLISDELWMQSDTSTDWWQKIRRFSRSTAVSSIIGSLLSLGDRHLDNLLIDFKTGQLIHVDFNVSFGKAKTLRVPEIVPFRLTRNIVNALGPFKTEGIFRCSAETTLEITRSKSFVFSSLISSLVYEPLTEWILPSKQFSMGTLNIGSSIIIYNQDRRSQFAAQTALHFLHLYLDILIPKFKGIREELETALMATCQLFTEMNNYRLNNGSELEHFADQRVTIGSRLKSAIIAHQNVIRILKPVLRILSSSDVRIASFMKTYRSSFSTPLVNGHRLLGEFQNIDYMTCTKFFKTALLNAESIYTQLAELNNIKELDMNFDIPMSAISCEDVSLTGPLFQESPMKSNENEIASEVLENCRLFLKGIDVEDKHEKSVSEQVQKLISNAADKTLLSRMFEGWCPWI